LDSLTTLVAGADNVDEAVHSTRTGIKRLRAYLRLARRSIGTNTYRTEDAALRDTARLLAPARDAFVVIETARDLGADATVLSVLTDEHAAMMDGFERTTRTDVLDRIGAISTRWRYLMWESPGAKSVGVGVKRTYRRSLARFETVRSSQEDGAFHAWRRQVKYVRYQLQMIDAPESIVAPFLTLGDDLGHEHDETVLIAICAERAGEPEFAAIAEQATLRRDELRITAVRLGSEVFSHQPESFRHTVEAEIGLR
jgi:CHAD domain-containing protein